VLQTWKSKWVLAFLLCLTTCNRPAQRAVQHSTEQYIAVPGSVGFDIQPGPAPGNSEAWLATYTAQGKTAKFRIELGPCKALDDKVLDMKSGDGKFIPEPGSDSSVLLADLKEALEAKTLPVKVQRASGLRFTFVSFEANESQALGGGFALQPRGNWTPMKIFIGEGEQEGEVSLNLNPVLKKGQFSIKHPDYGDIVLARLAEVL
jgi:hypothetical protein